MLASRDVAGSFRADAGRDLIRTARTMDPRNDKVRRERREKEQRGEREEGRGKRKEWRRPLLPSIHLRIRRI